MVVGGGCGDCGGDDVSGIGVLDIVVVLLWRGGGCRNCGGDDDSGIGVVDIIVVVVVIDKT